MAFAHTSGTPNCSRSDAVKILASKSLPIATTAESKSGIPSSRSAASSVESA